MRTLTAVLLALLLAGCYKPLKSSDFHGDDRTMVEAANLIRQAINSYHSETSEYPPDLRAAEGALPPGKTWPANPYTNAPITDSGGADFDPGKSIGTVYYETYRRTGAEEQIAGYRLHVFGKDKKLMVFDNSAFGAQ